MFIFDFVAETILDQILDWIYGKIIGFLNDFFVMMNNMGVELFELPWVNAVTTFFSYLGWALFGVGLVVGAFECAIEYQGGRGSIRDTAMNYIKGFMAVSLFTVVPVNLYSLCVSLQGTFGSAITGITNAESIGLTAQQVLMSVSFPGIGNPILMIFCAVMMGYAVIKVFFANLKRGGILLIQIAVGSLYMFSVPRGYIDGFIHITRREGQVVLVHVGILEAGPDPVCVGLEIPVVVEFLKRDEVCLAVVVDVLLRVHHARDLRHTLA